MKKFLKNSLVTCFVTMGSVLAVADTVNDSEVYVALKAGTLGVGIDLSTPIKEDLLLRFNLNGLTYSDDMDIDNINYNGDINLFNAGVLLDYFPFEGTTFRVSGGAYYNNNGFDGNAMPTTLQDITIGENVYTLNEVGRLNTNVEFDKIAPYLGIGWGNYITEKNWGLSLDLGIMYHGEPKVDLNADINPAIQGTTLEDEINANIVKESQQFLKDIKDFKFYPVVMIGVYYNF